MIKNESNTPLHFGNVYHINIDQGQNRHQNAQSTQNHQSVKKRDDLPPLEEVRPLYHSKRVVKQEELPAISRHMGANWKAVGQKLGFNHATLDHYEADTRSMVDAIQRMLFR